MPLMFAGNVCVFLLCEHYSRLLRARSVTCSSERFAGWGQWGFAGLFLIIKNKSIFSLFAPLRVAPPWRAANIWTTSSRPVLVVQNRPPRLRAYSFLPSAPHISSPCVRSALLLPAQHENPRPRGRLSLSYPDALHRRRTQRRRTVAPRRPFH